MASKYVDVTAIMQVVGNVFRNPQILDFTDKYTITEDDFPDEFHRIAFGAIYKIHELGADRISLENIADFLSSRPKSAATFSEESLPRTIIYSLDASDNAFIDTIIGAFQGTEVPGKLQHGSAWWFNDNKQGMKDQLISLANLSILGNFVGMLTDSRSFLSYTRHEYFRRILCSVIGEDLEKGKLPKSEMEFLHQMVKDISYNNADRYFNF